MKKEEMLNHFFQYEGETFYANYYPKNTDNIIVTFQAYDKNVIRRNKYGWGVRFLIEKDISILAIRPKENNWYRGEDLLDFMESDFIGEMLSAYKRHLFSGESMGGFAALVFSSIVAHSEVLAFNPQSTLNKDVVTWKIRFKEALEQDWTGRFSDANKLHLHKVFLVYDYYNDIDRMHAARIGGDEVKHLHLNHVGHSVTTSLVEARLLKNIMTMFLENCLNDTGFKAIQKSMKNLKSYQKKKIEYLIGCKRYNDAIVTSNEFKNLPDFANIFRDNAIKLEKENPVIAQKLMEQAYQIRQGPFIKEKLEEYRKKN